MLSEGPCCVSEANGLKAPSWSLSPLVSLPKARYLICSTSPASCPSWYGSNWLWVDHRHLPQAQFGSISHHPLLPLSGHLCSVHCICDLQSKNLWLGGDGGDLQPFWASLVAQMVRNLPAMQETWIQSLCQEDPLEKGMATHLSIFAWRIPRTEEPGVLMSIETWRAGHDWAANTALLGGWPSGQVTFLVRLTERVS